MKLFFSTIAVFFFCLGCQNTTVSKPDKLIEKDKMIDILYDMSLLEAVKTQNINGGLSTKAAFEFIKKKYKVDSIQFSQNNRYYAGNAEEYKEMIEEVKERLKSENSKVDQKLGTTTSPISNGISTQNTTTPVVY